jgi:hypothetical protein
VLKISIFESQASNCSEEKSGAVLRQLGAEVVEFIYETFSNIPDVNLHRC